MGFVDKGREPALIIPALRPLYERTAILYYPLLRITAGAFLLAHGWLKVMAGAPALVPFLTRLGFEPAIFWAWVMVLIETVGAICIILGLFTRPVAAALVIYFAIITFMVNWGNGFAWSAPRGGWEFPAFWGLVFLVILLRGGGPYSLDRKLGREF
jgi:putative oxidoreductase